MKIKTAIILLLTFFSLNMTESYAQCERLPKKRIKQLLGAAEYDNSRSTEIKTSDYTVKEEYRIDLFKDLVYKLIFDVSDMPEGVIINLYDLGNKRGAGKYELVFSSDTAERTKDNTYEVTMEFPQKKMMVSYDIINNTKPGCVSFVLGFYFKNNYR